MLRCLLHTICHHSRQIYSWLDQFHSVPSAAKIDARIVRIACWGRYHRQLEFLHSQRPFCETNLVLFGVVLEIDNIPHSIEVERLHDWVQVRLRMRPAIAIGRYHVAAMPSCCVTEVEVGIRYVVFQTDSCSDPANKLVHLDPPTCFISWITCQLLWLRLGSIRPNLCPLASMLVCSAMFPVILILAPFRVSLHFKSDDGNAFPIATVISRHFE